MKKMVKNFWSLNVDEALVANWLKQKDTLGSNYEVFFPINTQLEYVDLIVFNKKNKKTTTIQVKSSQIYLEKNGNYWVSGHRFEKEKINSKKVDFFIFTSYYPKTLEKDQTTRGIAEHYVVFTAKELEKYVEKYKDVKMIKTGKIGFSFYIESQNNKNELYEDWQIKNKYTENNYEELKPICNVLDNFNKIKQELKS
ncbi:MAG: hypothetical protein ACW9XH_08025 [Candidatus Nitrosopumilus sp. bin_32a]